MRNSRLWLYLIACAADVVGDAMWIVGLAWVVSANSSPGVAATALAAASIPRALLLIPAGALVDRFGAIRLAQAAQCVRVASTAVIGVASLRGGHPVLLLVAVSAVFGVADALRMPAEGALIPSVVSTTDDLPAAQGVLSVIYRFGTVVGAPLAGLLIGLHGFTAIAATNLLLFATALLVLGWLARRGIGVVSVESDAPTARAVLDGLAFVRRDAPIARMLLVVSVVNLAVAGPLELGVALLSHQDAWGGRGLGIAFAVFSAGATLGALSLTRWKPANAIRAGYLCSLISGLAIIALAWSSNLLLACLSLTVAGLGFGPSGGLLLGSIQRETPPDVLGRVMGIVSFTSIGLVPIGMLGFGVLASHAPTSTAIGLCGAIIVVSSAWAATRTHSTPAPHPKRSANAYP